MAKSLKKGANKLLPNCKDSETLSLLVLAALDGLIIQKLCGYKDIPIDKIVNLILENQ